MRPNIKSITGGQDMMVGFAIEANKATDEKNGKDMIVAGSADEKKTERSAKLNNWEPELNAKDR